MSKEKLQVRFTTEYKKAGGKNLAGIPWASLWEFLEAFLGGLCPAAMVKRMAQRNPDVIQERAMTFFKDEGCTASEAKKLALASVETIQKSPLKELKALVS